MPIFAVIRTIIQNRSEEMFELILFPSDIAIGDCNIGRYNGAA